MKTNFSPEEAREDGVLDAFERTIDLELRRYVHGTVERYPGTTIPVRARLALDLAARLRVVLKEHDEAVATEKILRGFLDAAIKGQKREWERAQEAEAELIEARKEIAEAYSACNICGKAWPEHEPACVYLANGKKAMQADDFKGERDAYMKSYEEACEFRDGKTKMIEQYYKPEVKRLQAALERELLDDKDSRSEC